MLFIRDTGVNRWTLLAYLMWGCERKILNGVLSWAINTINSVQPDLLYFLLFQHFNKIGSLAILCIEGGKYPAALIIRDPRLPFKDNPTELIINKILKIFDTANVEILPHVPYVFLQRDFLKTESDRQHNFPFCVAFYGTEAQIKKLLLLLDNPCIKDSFKQYEKATAQLLIKPIMGGRYKSLMEMVANQIGPEVIGKINDWLKEVLPNIQCRIIHTPPNASSPTALNRPSGY